MASSSSSESESNESSSKRSIHTRSHTAATKGPSSIATHSSSKQKSPLHAQSQSKILQAAKVLNPLNGSSQSFSDMQTQESSNSQSKKEEKIWELKNADMRILGKPTYP